jgi:hypothetical protein
MKKHQLHILVFASVFAGSVQAMDPSEEQIADENKYDKRAQEYFASAVKFLGNQRPSSFTLLLSLMWNGGLRAEYDAFPEEAKQWSSRCAKLSSNRMAASQDLEALLYECLHPTNKLMNDAAFIRDAIHHSSSGQNSACVAEFLYDAMINSKRDSITVEAELKRRDAEAANVRPADIARSDQLFRIAYTHKGIA